MNTSMNFELIPTGNHFEFASEDLERGFRRPTGAKRYGKSLQRRPRPGRPPSRPRRSFDYIPWIPWGAAPIGLNAAPDGRSAQYGRCMQDCLQARLTSPSAFRPRASQPDPGGDAGGNDSPDSSADAAFPDEEMIMHKPTCQCPQCTRGVSPFEILEFESPGAFESNGFGEYETLEGESQYEGPYESEGEYEGEFNWAGEGAGPFSEAEEIALAAELLSVSNEAELEQFLGKLWKGVKKVGSFVGKIAKPFSGVLKAVAKKALPFVGGALGSLIPIPGVGTAVGSALGGALSKALEMEFGEMELEDREFEMARRFVRIAGTAAQQLAQAKPGDSTQTAIESALAAAARQHLPHFRTRGPRVIPQTSGRWTRQGRTLVVIGV